MQASEKPWPTTPDEIRLARLLGESAPEFKSAERIIGEARARAASEPVQHELGWTLTFLFVLFACLAPFAGIVALQILEGVQR